MAARLFNQPFAQTQTTENIKAPRQWPFWGESTGDRIHYVHILQIFKHRSFGLWMFLIVPYLYLVLVHSKIITYIYIYIYTYIYIYRYIYIYIYIYIGVNLYVLTVLPNLTVGQPSNNLDLSGIEIYLGMMLILTFVLKKKPNLGELWSSVCFLFYFRITVSEARCHIIYHTCSCLEVVHFVHFDSTGIKKAFERI